MPSKQPRFRNVCFTLNNYTEEQLETILSWDKWSYVICGREVGDSGTPHLQGYGELTAKFRATTINNATFNAHLEPRRGTSKQAITYCKKDGNFVERGTARTPGLRSDLLDARQILKTKKRYRDVLRDPELDVIRAKYPKWVETTFRSKPPTRIDEEKITWKPWQQKIKDLILLNQPHPRKVHWIWSELGNKGKTFLALYFIRNHGALLVTGGYRDISYAYDDEPIVIWNLPRAADADKVSYKTMEGLKDGILFSVKYNSGMKVFTPPHVIIFANIAPNRNAMSSDRWDVHHLL